MNSKSPSEILGNPQYRAISYGGYRQKTRDQVPTVDEIQKDLKLLDALGIRILRTYNTQQYAHAENLLKAIDGLQANNPDFEMYVMLGAWIDCGNAWTEAPNHHVGDPVNNTAEIRKAVELAQAYPDIVKVISVGNEAMVHWAWSYWVEPDVILEWVNHLQGLKKSGELPSDLWITSSDNFASWGGADSSYHKPALIELMNAVDYISIHTYPFHDTHYNPEFWRSSDSISYESKLENIEAAMVRAVVYAKSQYQSVATFMEKNGVDKPLHIGETGWASYTNSLYGDEGSKAADEFKQKLYRDLIREWTDEERISCFFFEAFDEQWKDAQNPGGSENHFGLFTIDGQAKYVIWDAVDQGKFDGLARDGNEITKTFGGNEEEVLTRALSPVAYELMEN